MKAITVDQLDWPVAEEADFAIEDRGEVTTPRAMTYTNCGQRLATFSFRCVWTGVNVTQGRHYSTILSHDPKVFTRQGG